ncbi:5-hydroxytryptamine receptor 1F [Bienertia sinuspersici]
MINKYALNFILYSLLQIDARPFYVLLINGHKLLLHKSQSLPSLLNQKLVFSNHPHTKTKTKSNMRPMAKTIVPVVCLLIMVMDIVAGILGIEAQVAQNKERYMRVWIFECREPSYDAYRLGFAACVLLALAHVIANVLGGCVCISSREEYARSSPNRQIAAISLVFSWILLFIAFPLLVLGTVSNARSRQTCGFSHKHLLVIGGILCFIHGLFLVAYYVGSSAARAEEDRIFKQQRPTGPFPLPA